MNPETHKDVERAVNRLNDRLTDRGMIRNGWKLQYERGNQTYSRPHSMYLLDPLNGGHWTPSPWGDRLGSTVQEAMCTLDGILHTLNLLARSGAPLRREMMS